VLSYPVFFRSAKINTLSKAVFVRLRHQQVRHLTFSSMPEPLRIQPLACWDISQEYQIYRADIPVYQSGPAASSLICLIDRSPSGIISFGGILTYEIQSL
jgi:hypothetical protein